MGVIITAGKDYKEPRKRVQKPMRLLGMMRPWQLEQLTFKFREDLLSFCPKSERETQCVTRTAAAVVRALRAWTSS